jgi:hypothetical protein
MVMSLRSIAVRNYRCFEQRQQLEISPITVVLGKNNAGKSAILRAPLLAESGLNTESMAAFDLDRLRAPRVTHFSDLVFGREPFRGLGLEVETESGAKVEVEVRYDDDVARPIVQTLSLRVGARTLDITLDPKTGGHIATSGSEVAEVLGFRGLRPLFDASTHEGFHAGVRDCWPRLGSVHYIGPFRKPFKTVHTIPHNPPPGVGAFGEHTLELLAYDYAHGTQLIIRRVNEYLADLLPGYELRQNQLGARLWQTVVLGPWRSELDLSDLGSGVAQVLPILVQCAVGDSSLEPPGPALQLIEEPELHLHPAAHGQMADLLLRVARDTGDRFVIETHSETFLLRLRRRIAAQEATPEEIGLYVVEDEAGAATLRRIGIDEFGRLDHWPDGYFDQDYQEAKVIGREQLRRGVGGAS